MRKQRPTRQPAAAQETTRREQKKRGLSATSLLVLVLFLMGAGLLLYPTASNYYNVVHQSEAIVDYAENLSALDNEEIQRIWDEAVEYNNLLFRYSRGEELQEGDLHNYNEVLVVDDTGMMGYVDIPKISVHLPMYHGTSDNVLQKGVGHLQISSFPIGGENTHSVLTGHTGLPSARLFTDLDQLEVGDYFILVPLGVEMYYEIEEILVVLPYETESLAIRDGEDLCTLVTCTPYGVNSHRLLIRGHRIDEIPQELTESMETRAEKNSLHPMLMMIGIVLLFLLILLALIFWKRRKRKSKDDKK